MIVDSLVRSQQPRPGEARSSDIAAAIGLGKSRTNEILKNMGEAGEIRAEGTTHDRTYLANEGWG